MAKKQKILVVEDEPALSELYATKLKIEGYDVVVAEDGIAGIDKAMHELPDAILLDVLLPKKDGFSVLKDLKQSDKTKHIPVIILSSLGQDYEVKKGKQEGAADYLIKTEASPSDIAAKLKSVLKKK